jgi:hypothetical protein
VGLGLGLGSGLGDGEELGLTAGEGLATAADGEGLVPAVEHATAAQASASPDSTRPDRPPRTAIDHRSTIAHPPC